MIAREKLQDRYAKRPDSLAFVRKLAAIAAFSGRSGMFTILSGRGGGRPSGGAGTCASSNGAPFIGLVSPEAIC